MHNLEDRSAERKHFNKACLMEKIGGNQKFYIEILEMVKQGSIKRDILEIQAQISNRINPELIIKQAHRIIGSSGGACFEILSHLSDGLNKLEPWDWDQAQVLFDLIIEEMKIVDSIVDEEIRLNLS